MDALKYVSPGSPLVITAGTWNRFIDTARRSEAESRQTAGGRPLDGDPWRPALTVLVENTGDDPLEARTILTPTTVGIDPEDDPLLARRRPLIRGATPAAATDPVIIVLDGIAPGEVGRAVVSGATVAQVSISSTAHRFARPLAGYSSHLVSAESGPVRLLVPPTATGTKIVYVVLGDESGGGSAPVSPWKAPVRVATTTNGTLSSAFENGDTVDGVTLVTGDRILIKNQSSPQDNGIYTVNASGAPTLAADADTGDELLGATVTVCEGATQADTVWVCTANAPITVGSSSITWAQYGNGDVRFVAGASVVAGEIPTYTSAGAGKVITNGAAATSGTRFTCDTAGNVIIPGNIQIGSVSIDTTTLTGYGISSQGLQFVNFVATGGFAIKNTVLGTTFPGITGTFDIVVGGVPKTMTVRGGIITSIA